MRGIKMAMTQAERVRAAYSVHGYYVTRPCEESREGRMAAFDRAKAEYLAVMRKHIANVELLDYSSYVAGRDGK